MNVRALKRFSKILGVSGFLCIICAYIIRKARIAFSLRHNEPPTETVRGWISNSIPKWMNWIIQNEQHEKGTFNIRETLSFIFNVMGDIFIYIVQDLGFVLNSSKDILTEILFFLVAYLQRFFIIIVLLIIASVTVNVILGRKRKKKNVVVNSTDRTMMVAENNMDACPCQSGDISHNKYTKIAMCGGVVLLVAALISIPWEFLRLYQVEIAKRSALVQNGPPEECMPQKMSFLSYLLNGIKSYISWNHLDPCEKYYQALLVDPFWEVLPLMVLSSIATRCILHPLEILCQGMGKCLKLFFSEIPSQWQPIMLVVIVIVLLISLIMLCSYTIRFTLPCFFVFKARTPLQKAPSRTLIIRDRDKVKSDKPHKRKKLYSS